MADSVKTFLHDLVRVSLRSGSCVAGTVLVCCGDGGSAAGSAFLPVHLRGCYRI